MWNRFTYAVRALSIAVLVWLTHRLAARKLQRHLGQVSGLSNLPIDGGFILVANHESYFDNFVACGLIWLLLGKRVWIPTKEKAFNGTLNALWHHALGGVPIDQADPDAAYRTIEALLGGGEVVLMFPEGRRYAPGQLGEFRYGAFNLAVRSGRPIVPLALRGCGKVLPIGRRSFVNGARAAAAFGPLLAAQRTSRDADERAVARRLRAETLAFIAPFASAADDAGFKSERAEGQVSALFERRLERLLDDGLESITARDARPLVFAAKVLTRLWPACEPLQIQALRARGFWLLGAAKPLAALHLPRYYRDLKRALSRAPTHPYPNYLMGQLHARLPRILGGDPARATLFFRRAYEHAHEHGFDRVRFATSYASALATQGATEEALCLLRLHFTGFPQESQRLARRRARAHALMRELDPTSLAYATP